MFNVYSRNNYNTNNGPLVNSLFSFYLFSSFLVNRVSLFLRVCSVIVYVLIYGQISRTFWTDRSLI